MENNTKGDTLKYGLLLLAIGLLMTILHFLIGGTALLDFVSGFFLGLGSAVSLVSVVLCVVGVRKLIKK